MTSSSEPMPPPDPAYGAAGSAGDQYARPPRNGIGVAALVLGVVAIVASITVVGGVILGIIALVLGFIGRSRAKKGEATNGGVALAGIITGAVGVVLSIVLIAAGAAIFFKSGGQDLIDCVNNAHGNQSAIDQCNRDFQNRNSN